MLSALSKKNVLAIDGDVDMSFFTGVPQEEAYNLVADYFKGRGLRIVASDSPSYVNAEFGSWTSISLDNAKGEVKVDLVKAHRGSYANLHFDFSSEYLVGSSVTMFFVAATYIIYAMLEIPQLFALIVIFVEVIFVVGIIGYSVSLTRRKFIEEFNMFLQSLASNRE